MWCLQRWLSDTNGSCPLRSSEYKTPVACLLNKRRKSYLQGLLTLDQISPVCHLNTVTTDSDSLHYDALHIQYVQTVLLSAYLYYRYMDIFLNAKVKHTSIGWNKYVVRQYVMRDCLHSQHEPKRVKRHTKYMLKHFLTCDASIYSSDNTYNTRQVSTFQEIRFGLVLFGLVWCVINA